MTLLKSIVALLVLANVGYFLWDTGIAKSPDTVAAGTKSLKLASESVAAVAAAGAATGMPGAATGVPGTVAGAPGAVAGAPGAADGSATVGASGAAGAPGIAGSSGSAAGSNSAGNAADAAAGDVAPGSAAPALLSNVKRCVSVGPFRDVSEAARAAGTLRSGGYDPRQRVADGEVWAGVWVYLPLPPAQPAARQILDKLKAGGIDDALEMPGPNDTSVISLGLFSEPKRAQARVAQAQALSLNPAVADRKRTGSVYWIDVDLKPTDGMLNPSDLQGEAGRIVRLEVKGCPSAGGGSP